MNWGVLGCANIAQRSVIPAMLSIKENKLIAIGSREKSMAEKVAAQFDTIGIEGYENVLKRDDVEAVYIPLPNSLHFEWIMKALEAGKHVLVEKSAFVSLKDAEVAVQEARKQGLAIVENFQFQHHSQHAYVKTLLNQNEIGEVRCFRSSFGFPPFDAATNIRYEKALGGGALLDSGSYVLKATSFLFGNNFHVNASFLNYHPTYKVDWFGGAFLTNQTKGIFSEVAFGFDNYYQCNYEIWGSKGKITVNRAFTAKPDFAPTIILEKEGVANEVVLSKDDHFKNMLLHFNSITANNVMEVEWENVLYQAKLIEQIKSLAVNH